MRRNFFAASLLFADVLHLARGNVSHPLVRGGQSFSWNYDTIRLDTESWNRRVEATAMDQIQALRATEGDLVLLSLDAGHPYGKTSEFRLRVLRHNIPLRRTSVTKDFLVLRSGRLCRRATAENPARTALDLLSVERERRVVNHVSDFSLRKLRFDRCYCWRLPEESDMRTVTLTCDVGGLYSAATVAGEEDLLQMASAVRSDGSPLIKKNFTRRAADEFLTAARELEDGNDGAHLDLLRVRPGTSLRAPYDDMNDYVEAWDSRRPPATANLDHTQWETVQQSGSSGDGSGASEDEEASELTSLKSLSSQGTEEYEDALRNYHRARAQLASHLQQHPVEPPERDWMVSEEAQEEITTTAAPALQLSDDDDTIQSWPLVSEDDLNRLYGNINVDNLHKTLGPFVCYASPNSALGRARQKKTRAASEANSPTAAVVADSQLPGRNVFVVVPKLCATAETPIEVPVILRQFQKARKSGNKMEKQLTFSGCHCWLHHGKDENSTRLHLDCHDKAHHKVTITKFASPEFVVN